ncbi:hypothetical protein ES708_24504 [subsurface metagenome]
MLLTAGSTPELEDFSITYDSPTMVNLVEFYALGLFGKVKVIWKTASEFENAGFNLYRSQNTEDRRQNWVKLNKTLISGLGNSLDGRAYHFMDYDVIGDETYYYWLEEIDFNGNKRMYGPVAGHPGRDTDGNGMPDDWEIYYGLDPYRDDANEDPDGDGLTNLEEFLAGTDPSAPNSSGSAELFEGLTPWTVLASEFAGSSGEINEGLRIISSDDSGIILELVTARFNAIPRELTIDEQQSITSIYQVLEIPGYIHGYTAEAGKAQMPLKPVLLGIPQGVACSIEHLEVVADVISPTCLAGRRAGYNIYPAEGYEDQWVTTKGYERLQEVTESYKMITVPDPGFYASDTNYPAEVVQLVGTTSLRGQGIACLNLYPLGYNPAQQQLQLRYRIRFKLVFSPTREFSPPPVEPPLVLPPVIPQLKIALKSRQ